MKRSDRAAAGCEDLPLRGDALGASLHAEFPHLHMVHEIEIRGSLRWETLAESSLCLKRCGAEPVSLTARRYDEKAQSITYRIRSLSDAALEAAVLELTGLDGVIGVHVSHHLGRASGLGPARCNLGQTVEPPPSRRNNPAHSPAAG